VKNLWGAIICLLLGLTPVAFGQTESASKTSTWSASGGASVLHVFGNRNFDGKGTATIPGWRGTASEYPFPTCPWVGGTVQVSGYYYGASENASNGPISASATTRSETYTLLMGPSIALGKKGPLQPFANALIGVLHGSGKATVVFSGVVSGASAGSGTNLATSAGGGFDFPLSSRWKVRTEVNWLRAFASGNSVDFLEASAGLAFKF
jgi:opacity protein-like surface antigen